MATETSTTTTTSGSGKDRELLIRDIARTLDLTIFEQAWALVKQAMSAFDVVAVSPASTMQDKHVSRSINPFTFLPKYCHTEFKHDMPYYSVQVKKRDGYPLITTKIDTTPCPEGVLLTRKRRAITNMMDTPSVRWNVFVLTAMVLARVTLTDDAVTDVLTGKPTYGYRLADDDDDPVCGRNLHLIFGAKELPYAACKTVRDMDFNSGYVALMLTNMTAMCFAMYHYLQYATMWDYYYNTNMLKMASAFNVPTAVVRAAKKYSIYV